MAAENPQRKYAAGHNPAVKNNSTPARFYPPVVFYAVKFGTKKVHVYRDLYQEANCLRLQELSM